MFRPSGETSGSPAHCSSNTSIGLNAGFAVCANPGDAALSASTAAAVNMTLMETRLTIVGLFAGRPAVTLMFIDDPHGLHEGIANRGSDEFESFLLEILAHRIAVGGRLGNPTEIQRTAAPHPAIRDLPDVVPE